MNITRTIVICITWLALTSATPLHGQSERSIGLVAGASQYDLSGTGTAPFAALRFDFTPAQTRFLVLEAAIQWFSYRTQFEERRHYWFPEVMIQAQLPGVTVRPYVGVGAGYSFSEVETAPTLAGAAGLRIALPRQWLMRGELRIRAVDPWTATTADWGIGLSRRF